MDLLTYFTAYLLQTNTDTSKPVEANLSQFNTLNMMMHLRH